MMFRRKNKDPKKYLNQLDVDLDVYDFLGTSNFRYNDIPHKWVCYFFVEKHDYEGGRRLIKVLGNAPDYKHHSWFFTHAVPWELGQGELYKHISGTVSDKLNAYVIQKFGYMWDTETHSYVPASAEKLYERAAATQSEANNDVIERIEDINDNIVSVNFKKD